MMVPQVNFSKKNIAILATISISMILMCLGYVYSDSSSNYLVYDGEPVAISYNGSVTDARPRYKKNKPMACLFDTSVVASRNQTTKKEWEQCLNGGKKPEYYLSIVIVTRMDDYAG